MTAMPLHNCLLMFPFLNLLLTVCVGHLAVLPGGGRLGRDFPHPFRPVLEPTQPRVQCIPGNSRG